ncbi:MAG: hypothetical protein KF753_08875 [Caldilineaceae bacterium]|nr:hypothetical protein [Caldilineaceae bacterium]
MIAETRPLTEITQEALRLLFRELGLVNTVRFLNQFTAGYGNYTEERRAATENQTLDELLAEVYAHQAEKSSQTDN